MDSMKKIYHFISTMKTGLMLLVLLGLAAAMGRVIFPDSFSHAILFKMLLLLLLINMTCCTINRIIWFKSVFIYKRRKGFLKQFGILLLHAGIVLIMIGGVIFSCYGGSEQIQIVKHETKDISHVIKTNQVKPISMHLDDFKIEFNDDGSASQYYSFLTLLEDGQTKEKAVISVNHPLNCGGVKAYQMSFGYKVKVKHINSEGMETEDLFNEGDVLKIPGTERVVKIFRYIPNFDPAHGMTSITMRSDNPRIIFSVYENNNLLGVGAVEFGERVEIDNNVFAVFTGVEPYTVLCVKSDPGLPMVLSGGVMFMLGVCLALLTSHSKKAVRK
ncbi:MAG: cytochrome c biogenesis protein ResB [Bacillota bacterium]|nr:cytochrome c biogenesis protein ResB [Bacillota bacterium]